MAIEGLTSAKDRFDPRTPIATRTAEEVAALGQTVTRIEVERMSAAGKLRAWWTTVIRTSEVRRLQSAR